LRKSRRQFIIRAVEITGATLVVLDLLLYFGAYRYAQSMLFSEQQQFESLRRGMFEAEDRIERLKKSREALPVIDKKLAALEHDHTPPRRQAGSQTAKLVRTVTEKSGAQLDNVAFKFEEKTSGPLERAGVVINVEGPFPALLKFAHGLETSGDLLVIRSFNMVEADEGILQLRLVADLYLTP